MTEWQDEADLEALIDVELCHRLARAGASEGAEGAATARRELASHVVEMIRRQVATHLRIGQWSEDDQNEVVVRVTTKLQNGHRALCQYADWQPRFPDKTFGDWLRIVVKREVFEHHRRSLGRQVLTPGRVLRDLMRSTRFDELGLAPPRTESEMSRLATELAERDLPAAEVSRLRLWLEGRSSSELDADMDAASGSASRAIRRALGSLRRVLGVEATPSRNRFLNSYEQTLEQVGWRPPRTREQLAREVIEFAGAHLSEGQFEVLKLWLEDQDDADIAQRLKLPTETVTRERRAGVARLRRHFTSPGS